MPLLRTYLGIPINVGQRNKRIHHKLKYIKISPKTHSLADAAMADEIAQMVVRQTVELEAPGSSILMLFYYVCVPIFHPRANSPSPLLGMMPFPAIASLLVLGVIPKAWGFPKPLNVHHSLISQLY